MSTGTESMGSASSCGSGSGSGNPNQDDDNAPLWRYVTKVEKLGKGRGNTKF